MNIARKEQIKDGETYKVLASLMIPDPRKKISPLRFPARYAIRI